MTTEEIVYLCILCFIAGSVVTHMLGYNRFKARRLVKQLRDLGERYGQEIQRARDERNDWQAERIVLKGSATAATERNDRLREELTNLANRLDHHYVAASLAPDSVRQVLKTYSKVVRSLGYRPEV